MWQTFYQPGEQHLAVKVYQAFGCRVSDTTFGQGNEGLVIHVEPDQDDLVNNVVYAAEVTPAQWQFEQELRGALGEREALARAFASSAHHAKTSPSRSPTLGFRYASFRENGAGAEAVGGGSSTPNSGTAQGCPGLPSAGGHVFLDRGRDIRLRGHRRDCRWSVDAWPDHRAASPAAKPVKAHRRHDMWTSAHRVDAGPDRLPLTSQTRGGAVALGVLEPVRLWPRVVLDAHLKQRSGTPKHLEPTVDLAAVEAVRVESVPNQGNELLVVLVGWVIQGVEEVLIAFGAPGVLRRGPGAPRRELRPVGTVPS